jgi:catalase-peroxidase
VPDAHDPKKKHAPIMFTTDLALRIDPSYEKISRRFLENPEEFADAFAKAWFKLTHRDMGPIARYLGPLVPKEQLIWQDPFPRWIMIDRRRILLPEGQDPRIRAFHLATGHDGLGVGGDVPRRRQARRGQRRAHSPCAAEGLGSQPAGRAGEGLADAGGDPEGVQCAQSGGKKVSLADLIVLGGCAAVEEAAKKAGHDVKVPFSPGARMRRRSRPMSTRLPCWSRPRTGSATTSARDTRDRRRSCWWIKANLLTLTAPEMTVLIGGLRALNANFGQSDYGVFTKRPGTLTNDFFVNLLDMNTKWQKSAASEGVLEGHDRATGEHKWTGTVVDLVFGSNSQLRALAEVYACGDSQQAFVHDFVAAWSKVMNLDRFDLA